VNLLAVPCIKAVLRSRLYPAVFEWITAATLAALLLWTLFGPNNGCQNFGMALIWTIWWPLLPLSFLLLGRFWCAVCPFAWVTDRVRQAVGVELPVPPALRRYGAWTIAGLFILVTYIDQIWSFDRDTRRTGYLLLAILAAAVFFGAFFERRTFCRHVCFLGAFAANYSRAGILEIRADQDRCHECSTQACYRGSPDNPGCPVFLFPPQVEDSGTCQLCANCVKDCPHDAIRLTLRAPASELWSVREPRPADAVLAAIVAGAVLLEHFVMLPGWNGLVVASGAWLGVDPYVNFRLVFSALVTLFLVTPLAALALAAWCSQGLAGHASRAEFKRNFSWFGYALVPLALAGHLAYGLGRLLMWSRTLPYAAAATVGWFPPNQGGAWMSQSHTLRLESMVMLLGGAVSFDVAFRIVRKQRWRAFWVGLPHFLCLVSLLAANLHAVV